MGDEGGNLQATEAQHPSEPPGAQGEAQRSSLSRRRNPPSPHPDPGILATGTRRQRVSVVEAAQSAVLGVTALGHSSSLSCDLSHTCVPRALAHLVGSAACRSSHPLLQARDTAQLEGRRRVDNACPLTLSLSSALLPLSWSPCMSPRGAHRAHTATLPLRPHTWMSPIRRGPSPCSLQNGHFHRPTPRWLCTTDHPIPVPRS